jgi:hypothetical protein
MLSLNVTIHGNPDRNQGEWKEDHTISATNITELRKAILAFQGDNNIGGGNWGEAVLAENGRRIGYMSYNMRVWKTPYWNGQAEEIIL